MVARLGQQRSSCHSPLPAQLAPGATPHCRRPRPPNTPGAQWLLRSGSSRSSQELRACPGRARPAWGTVQGCSQGHWGWHKLVGTWHGALEAQGGSPKLGSEWLHQHAQALDYCKVVASADQFSGEYAGCSHVRPACGVHTRLHFALLCVHLYIYSTNTNQDKKISF